MIENPTDQEINIVINSYIENYTNYENDILDLVEFCKYQEDKARLLVLKRYPQLQIN